LIALPDLHLMDEIGRRVEARNLIHLQSGIVRMTDHELSVAQVDCSAVGGAGELPKPQLTQARLRLVRALAGRSRATARSLYVGFDRVKHPVAELRDGM